MSLSYLLLCWLCAQKALLVKEIAPVAQLISDDTIITGGYRRDLLSALELVCLHVHLLMHAIDVLDCHGLIFLSPAKSNVRYPEYRTLSNVVYFFGAKAQVLEHLFPLVGR